MIGDDCEHLSIAWPSMVSLKRVHCDKAKELSANIFIQYETSMHLVFQHEEWLLGDVPFYFKFSAKVTDPLQNADFQSIIARSASAITPSEKSLIITNRKSTMRFPTSLR